MKKKNNIVNHFRRNSSLAHFSANLLLVTPFYFKLVKVFGRKNNETTLAMYSVKITVRSSFTR